MKVLFAFGDSSARELNTSLHRVFMPMKMLNEAGHECYLTHATSLFVPQRGDDFYGIENWNTHILSKYDLRSLYGREAYDAMRSVDAVVIERLITRETHQTIKWLRKIGKRVYCSFDDAYHIMPLNGAVRGDTEGIFGSQGMWRGGKGARGGTGSLLYEFREGLRLCNGALVPSRLLMEDYRQYQPNMQYVPNFLYAPLWENLPKRNPDTIFIGYGASSLHVISLRQSGVIPALKMICDKYPKVSFFLQPPNPDMMKILKAGGVRFATGNYQEFTEWPKTVAQFHIGIAPLDGEYDFRRSSLKAIEYASAGVPWVATHAAPYENCRGGILVKNDRKHWFRALDSLVSNLTLYNNLSEEGLTWSKDFNSQCAAKYEEALSA